jgi:hypothetical protein
MTKLNDLLHDILPVVEKAAPLVAGILGGPAGTAAEVLINLLAKYFGASSSSVKDIAECMQCDPEVHIKLAALEKEHADLLAKLATFGRDIRESVPHHIEININLDNNK